MKKRVCVIGAGPSGITSIKTALEDGLEAICYEKTNNFGGLWRYRNEDAEGVPSVMKSTIINSSKEMSSLSDFPPSPSLANFMHNTGVVKYLTDYIEAFDLNKYIKYNHSVVNVDYADDYDKTGKWKIKIEEKGKGVKEEIFDYVLACVGHHVYPSTPKFSGIDEFKGTTIHSHSYKEPTQFKDKNVLVVGIGNSAGDVAVELSRISRKVYLSTRRGTWIMNRVWWNGYPLDVIMLSRFMQDFRTYTPWNIANKLMEFALNSRFNHAHYGLKPKHHVFQQHIMVNDDMPNRIASGMLIIKDDIHKFHQKTVSFKGEEDAEYPIDDVVFATGYNIAFPLLPDAIVTSKENEVHLYKYVFPPHLKHPTLAIIGLIQPLGSVLPISEMQARWAVRVFNGSTRLPSKEVMEADIQKVKNYMDNNFVRSPRHTIQVDYVAYVDELAKLIGVKPKLWKLLFTNPKKFLMLYFGPCYPYQYRLNGPHSWSGALDAVKTGKERILAPLRARQTKEDKMKTMNPPRSFSLSRMIMIIFFMWIVLAILF